MSESNPTAPTEEKIAALRAELDRISHPAAKIYPLLIDSDPDGWKKFYASIQKDQEHPIIFNRQGQLLAGRNRWLACKMQGREPKMETRDLTGAAAVEFIRCDNIDRRHDDIATRGMQTTKLLEMAKADPKNFGPAPTQVEAAEEAGMSDATLRVLEQLNKTHPDIAAELGNGKLPPHTAKKLSKKPQAEIDKALAAIRPAKNKKEAKKILKQMDTLHTAAPKPRKDKPKKKTAASKGMHPDYAVLFEELDQLPTLFDKHALSSEHLDELIAELRKALDFAIEMRRAQQVTAEEAKATEADEARETEAAAA